VVGVGGVRILPVLSVVVGWGLACCMFLVLYCFRLTMFSHGLGWRVGPAGVCCSLPIGIVLFCRYYSKVSILVVARSFAV
jgi:hypothetical protein